MKATKTAKGRRHRPAPDTIAVLAKQRKAALAAGRIASPVFHDADGGYLRLYNLAELLQADPPQAALPCLPVRPAPCGTPPQTLLLLADQPAKVVSERLGHSSITLTLDTYSHVLPTMQKRAADVMGTILGAAQKAKRATAKRGRRDWLQSGYKQRSWTR